MGSTAERERHTRRGCWVLLAVSVSILVYCCIFPVYSRVFSVCEHTGSERVVVTWFGVFQTTACSRTLLEEFIETKYPGTLTHKWVYVSSVHYKFVSGYRGDSFEPVALLAGAMSHDDNLTSLSDVNKRKLYDLLVYASANLSNDAKRKLYSDLLNKQRGQLVDSLETYQIPVIRKQ